MRSGKNSFRYPQYGSRAIAVLHAAGLRVRMTGQEVAPPLSSARAGVVSRVQGRCGYVLGCERCPAQTSGQVRC